MTIARNCWGHGPAAAIDRMRRHQFRRQIGLIEYLDWGFIIMVQMRVYLRWVCGGSLLAMSCLGWAQSSSAQSPSPAAKPAVPTTSPALSPAQISAQNSRIMVAALAVVHNVDQGRIGALWDGASTVAKQAVTREMFMKQIASDRAQLGQLVSRGPGSVSRIQHGPGAAVPTGLYLNVSFPCKFAHLAQPVRELVSLRLDEDHVWRLSGYSVRMPIQIQ